MRELSATPKYTLYKYSLYKYTLYKNMSFGVSHLMELNIEARLC